MAEQDAGIHLLGGWAHGSLPHQCCLCCEAELRLTWAMNTVFFKFSSLECHNLEARAGFFYSVSCGFHAVRESFPGRELYPWMASWFHALPIQWSHVAKTPTQSPLSIPGNHQVRGRRNEVEAVVCCSERDACVWRVSEK